MVSMIYWGQKYKTEKKDCMPLFTCLAAVGRNFNISGYDAVLERDSNDYEMKY